MAPHRGARPHGWGAGICQDATPGPTYAPSRDLGAMGLRDTGPVSLHPERRQGRCTGSYGTWRRMDDVAQRLQTIYQWFLIGLSRHYNGLHTLATAWVAPG